MPYGTDTDNQTLNVRLLLWEVFHGLWMARTGVIVACTFNSTLNGVSGSVPSDTEFLCDVITFTSGDSSAIIPVVGANNLAWVDMNMDGAKKVEFEFDRGTAASGNALFRFH
ncbi:MAG: hypothetical protein ACR2MX_10980 [Cyclobacteriaceae bacterium]